MKSMQVIAALAVLLVTSGCNLDILRGIGFPDLEATSDAEKRALFTELAAETTDNAATLAAEQTDDAAFAAKQTEDALIAEELTLPAEDTLGCQTSIVGGNRDHGPYINMPRMLELTLTYDSVTQLVALTGPDPFARVEGSLLKTNIFTLEGEGTFAGYPNVGISGEGNFKLSPEVVDAIFTYILEGKNLPGGEGIAYEFECSTEE